MLFVPTVPPKALYTIDCAVQFDSATAVITGSETIVLINNSALPLEELAFDWPQDSLHALSVSVNSVAVEVLSPTGDSGASSPTIIDLPARTEPGQELELTLQFMVKYPIDSSETDYLWTEWFPRIDWGERSQDDFAVRLEYSPEYEFASSGLYDQETDRYSAVGVRCFGIYLAKGAQVLDQMAGDVLVRVVHTAKGTDCAQLLMETAVDAISFYRERFGFYPADHIDVIPGMENPNGGYPPATNLVVIHGMEKLAEREKLHWQWIMAHEIGHQYWYEYVMAKPSDQFGWLMIGLGIYVDREYIRARDLPPDKHRQLIGRYIDGVLEGLDTRADVDGYYFPGITFDFNNVVIHGKGYSIISALNCLLGDSLFDSIHARCLNEFAGRRMGFPDFQSVCEQESGQDLDWFFDQWVRSSPYLSYEIVSQECGASGQGYVSEIKVARRGTLDMPVPVTAHFADSTSQTVLTGRRRPVSIVRFASDSPLTEAVIDAKGELALVIPPPSEEEVKIRQALSSIPDPAEIKALPELTGKALEMNIQKTLFWGQLGRRLYDWKYYEEALAVFKRRAQLLEEIESPWVRSAYAWQGLILDLLGRRSDAVEAYKHALEVDTDQDFSYDGDPVTISREWLEERLTTPNERP
jgi:hypothetical protein